ncbi:hypothetical protein D3C72_834660 [compost metagenome]
MATVADDPFHAAPRLFAGFLKVEGVHRAFKADVQFIDGALGDRADGDAVKAQVLEDSGDVGLGSRQPVQGFADHHVELAALGGPDHRKKAWAVDAL